MPTLWAQRTVSGTVSDAANGEPIEGVAVIVKGTTTGMFTDASGGYSLQVPESGKVLVFSYVGYVTIETEITGSRVNMSLQEDAFELEEVVVTGFGTTKRKDLTGAVSSISGDALVDVPDVGIQNALQGRASGVQVTKNSGTPGGGIDVRVRGSTSISASNQPLFVIDGVPLIAGSFSQNGVGGAGTNALADINPNDIESIEVLKDASTAAIYGSRGANGVVLITTKKGTRGTTKVTLNTNYGVQEAWKTIPMLNAQQYYGYIFATLGDSAALGQTDASVNWQDEIFQQGNITDNTLAISGGDLKTRFYTSLTYSNNNGIVKGSSFQRISGRVNLDHTVSDRFKVGMSMNYVTSDAGRIQNDNNIYGAVSSAILNAPDIPIFNPDGSFGSRYGLENPVAATTIYRNNAVTNRLIGNFFGEYELLPGLSAKASLGVDNLSFREEIYEPVQLVSARGSNGYGFVGQSLNSRWVTDYTLNLNKAFGKSSISAVAGFGMQEDKLEQVSAEVTDFPTSDFTTLNAGASVQGASANYTIDGLTSYFGNARYSFDDKYILQATFRADGSSRFGPENKFGYFPGVSAAWRLSSESFMSGASFINDMKIRASWGVTGNNSIGNFSALQLYSGGANYLDQPGISPTQLGNPALRWESTAQTNVGLDFTIVNNRISGNIDYFSKLTTDLLLNRPIPTTSGFTSVLENIGSVKNSGFEFQINTRNVVGAFSWETGFNFARIRNEVLELYNDNPIDVGFASRIAEGQSLGVFYGYVTDGIFQTQEEIDNSATQSSRTAPGDIKFKDLNEDGIINDDDREYIGSAQPDFVGGLTNRFTWNGFALDFFFQFSYGNEIYNNNTVFAEGMNSVFNQTERIYTERWIAGENEHNDTRYPRA
ncbi:MAG: TonB-dependent receptor, partial [Bacteroidia bacterium]|nr:TonB-dependent receptor [Bacteroidia bacterium]